MRGYDYNAQTDNRQSQGAWIVDAENGESDKRGCEGRLRCGLWTHLS